MADSQPEGRSRALWRDRWRRVIFDNDTLAGRWFDGLLLTLIVFNLLLVAMESVRSIGEAYGFYLDVAEWIITAIFTIEYAARLVSAPNARRYAMSFYGLVDLLAIAPIYASVLFGLTNSFTVVRSLRLLRVFSHFEAVRISRRGGRAGCCAPRKCSQDHRLSHCRTCNRHDRWNVDV